MMKNAGICQTLSYQINKLCTPFLVLQSEKTEGIDVKTEGVDAADVFAKALQDSQGPAVAAAASGMSSPRYISSQPGSPKTAGDFFELLTSSDFYKNTKVCF